MELAGLFMQEPAQRAIRLICPLGGLLHEFFLSIR